jgi:predicted nucleotidyltransferase
MKKNTLELKSVSRKILPILKKYSIKKAGIFGSYAKGTNKKSSDLDLLVEIKNKYSLLDLVKIKLELEKKLQKKIDLVEYSTIHPLIKKEVLKSEVRIL